MSDDLRALAAKWRTEADDWENRVADGVWSPTYIAGLKSCASELEAALSAAQSCPNSQVSCADPHCVEHRGSRAIPIPRY